MQRAGRSGSGRKMGRRGPDLLATGPQPRRIARAGGHRMEFRRDISESGTNGARADQIRAQVVICQSVPTFAALQR